HRPAASRPASVHPHRRAQLRDRGRAHPCRAQRGLAHRELVAGWRQQGHLDRRPRRRVLRPVHDTADVPAPARWRPGPDTEPEPGSDAQPDAGPDAKPDWPTGRGGRSRDDRLMAVLSRVAERLYWGARYLERA